MVALASLIGGCASKSSPGTDASVVEGQPDAGGGRVPCVMPALFPGEVVERCAEGLICHIDGTCIEPGVADEHGVATLVGPRKQQLGSFGEARGFGAILATDDAVIWHDRGTAFPNSYDDAGDGSLYRLDFATGSVAQLTSRLGSDTPLIRDDDAMYYQSLTQLQRMQLDGASDRALAITFGREDRLSAWTALGGFVYYARAGDRALMRHDASSGVESTVWSAPVDSSIGFVTAGSGRLFAATAIADEMSAQLWMIDLSDFSARVLIDELPRTAALGVVAHEGWLVFADGAISRISVERPGEPELLAPSEGQVTLQSASDGFVYYVGYVVQSEWQHTLARVALSGGEPEILRETMMQPSSVVALGDMLYWIEGDRLLRMTLGKHAR